MRFRLISLNLFSLAVFIGLQVDTCFGQKNVKTTAEILSISVDESVLVLPCPNGCDGDASSKDSTLEVRVEKSRGPRETRYQYKVSAGTILGSGKNVRWNLEDQHPGTYTISVTAFRGQKRVGETKTATVTIELARCYCDCFCPVVKVEGSPSPVKDGDTTFFVAIVEGGPDVTYNWTVEKGEILSGQGTVQIEVRVKTTGPTQEIIGTVQLGGIRPSCNCPTTASMKVRVVPNSER